MRQKQIEGFIEQIQGRRRSLPSSIRLSALLPSPPFLLKVNDEAARQMNTDRRTQKGAGRKKSQFCVWGARRLRVNVFDYCILTPGTEERGQPLTVDGIQLLTAFSVVAVIKDIHKEEKQTFGHQIYINLQMKMANFFKFNLPEACPLIITFQKSLQSCNSGLLQFEINVFLFY